MELILDLDLLMRIVFASMLIAYPLITLFHELGHALPALLFTKGPVSVVYGYQGKTMRGLRMGRLTLFAHWSFADWRHNFCTYDTEPTTKWQQAAITLGGAVLPLLAATSFAMLSWFLHWHIAALGIGLGLSCMALISAVFNLWPDSQPIIQPDGAYQFNDGYKLLQLWRDRHSRSNAYLAGYDKAVMLYNLRDFQGAIAVLQMHIQKDVLWPEAIHILVDAYYLTGQYAHSKRFAKIMKTRFPTWVDAQQQAS